MISSRISCRHYGIAHPATKAIALNFLFLPMEYNDCSKIRKPPNSVLKFWTPSVYWEDTVWSEIENLIKILMKHIIDYAQSNPGASVHSRTSPLLVSEEGLRLITFANDWLAGGWGLYQNLSYGNRISWGQAMGRVKEAHSNLPPDCFQRIFHEGVRPIIPDDLPGQGNVSEGGTQAGNSGNRMDGERGEDNCHPDDLHGNAAASQIEPSRESTGEDSDRSELGSSLG